MDNKKDIITYWDGFFKEHTPIKIDLNDVKVESTFDHYLKFMGDHAAYMMDIGCGMGTSLMKAKILGDAMVFGLGIDASLNAITYAEQTSHLSGITGLSFIASDVAYLKTIKDQSYDGIITSNFLDVIPKDLSGYVIKEITRIIKPGGYLLCKLNFYLDEALIKKLNMTEVSKNTYAMQGVIRAYNLSDDDWMKRFKGFKVIEKAGFQRAPHLPLDRMFLLLKTSNIK